MANMHEQGSTRIAKEGVTTPEYTLGSNNQIQIDTDGHTHFYSIDRNGNGVAYSAYHPLEEKIHHEHQIDNWQVRPAQSNCFPRCEDLYGIEGVSLHSHYLQREIITQASAPFSKETAPGTHFVMVENAPLLNSPYDGIGQAKIGPGLPRGVSVQVTREMVNHDYSAIKVIPGSAQPPGEDGPNKKIEAFGTAGAKKLNFYIRSNLLVPYNGTRIKILQKLYVAPQKMSKLERLLVPNWVHMTEPYYHKGKAEYWVVVKMPYECVADPTIYEPEAKEKGVKQLFGYYNLSYGDDDEHVKTFAEGFLSCKVHDYHLEPRPGSKLKMLVQVKAIYFDWLRNNHEERETTKVSDTGIPEGKPEPFKKLTLDPLRYKEGYAKISLLLSKWDRDMRMQGARIPGKSLAKGASRVQSFTNQLDKFLIANGLDISERSKKDFLIDIGFDEDMQVSYIVVKPRPKVPLSKPRIGKLFY